MLGAQPRQGVGMWHHTTRVVALALAVGALACSDRPPGTAPDAGRGPDVIATATTPELLARSLALALGDPAFRAHVKGELDRSPYREHKLPFQRFLTADRGAAAPSRPWRDAPASRRPTWPAQPTAPSRSRCTSPFRSTAAPGLATPTCWWRRRSPITTRRWRSMCRATGGCSTPSGRPRPRASR